MNTKTLILITIIATISTLGIALGNESIKQDLKKMPTSTLIQLDTELKKLESTPQQNSLMRTILSNTKSNIEEQKDSTQKISQLQKLTQKELQQRLKSNNQMMNDVVQKSVKEKQDEIQRLLDKM